MAKTLAYAATSEKAPLAPFSFDRRDLRPHDVKIEILYCGVCHSDLHQVKNEWKGTIYPVVPGHEIVGRVTEVGKEVKDFKVGDFAAVGCLVDSCRECSSCKEHLEQYCENEMTFTYNSKDKIDGTITYGGYSSQIVVDDKYVLRVPKEFSEADLPGVAPLLCAGITTYSPLRHWKVGKGSRVGVVGIGGLGHMAIKLAHAMGAHVVVFTTSESKLQDAKKLGADEAIVSKNQQDVKKFANSLDFIIDTVSAQHNLDTYLELLKLDGTLCLVGAPDHPHPSPNVTNLIFKRRKLGGSLIGGIKETQEMLDFCAQHHILSEIELIPIQKINEAYERMLKSDVKYRFVIDNSTLKTS
ncbi:MAG: NAD(P)-dependent alcohol dehydrogenase [Chlamydiales bacterium]|nr:NAD(P)-dependent alcohol dehydrogenase [Chlamydiales bacterium]